VTAVPGPTRQAVPPMAGSGCGSQKALLTLDNHPGGLDITILGHGFEMMTILRRPVDADDRPGRPGPRVKVMARDVRPGSILDRNDSYCAGPSPIRQGRDYLRASHRTLPLAKGELEGVLLEAVRPAQDPPQSPLREGGRQAGETLEAKAGPARRPPANSRIIKCVHFKQLSMPSRSPV
jgi:hypothetical protein